MTDTPPPPSNLKNRTIFTRDCLEVMRGMSDGCVDLIYLDPPFNSNANYAAPVGSEAAGAEFKDIWGLSDIDLAWYGQIADEYPGLYELLTATRSVHGNSMMSYLIYMTIRIMEMKRILKDTGSIYLHCDLTASHYLKLMMDDIFGKGNFRNEIVWCYPPGGRPPKYGFHRKHDVLFYYSKGSKPTFLHQYTPLDEKARAKFTKVDDDGRRYKEYRGKTRTYLDEVPGRPVPSWWIDIHSLGQTISSEAVGYPTQKPLALLQRIIRASSNEGEIVLDPFCGCATACVAAEIEGRQWIGIDVSSKAYELVKSRLVREVNIGDGGMFGDVIHRTDIPGDRKGKKSKNIRHIRYGEQEGRCTGCREHFPFRNMTEDHITPKAKGGPDTDDNIQLLCGACNSKKGARMTHGELVAILVEEGIRK